MGSDKELLVSRFCELFYATFEGSFTGVSSDLCRFYDNIDKTFKLNFQVGSSYMTLSFDEDTPEQKSNVVMSIKKASYNDYVSFQVTHKSENRKLGISMSSTPFTHRLGTLYLDRDLSTYFDAMLDYLNPSIYGGIADSIYRYKHKLNSNFWLDSNLLTLSNGLSVIFKPDLFGNPFVLPWFADPNDSMVLNCVLTQLLTSLPVTEVNILNRYGIVVKCSDMYYLKLKLSRTKVTQISIFKSPNDLYVSSTSYSSETSDGAVVSRYDLTTNISFAMVDEDVPKAIIKLLHEVGLS